MVKMLKGGIIIRSNLRSTKNQQQELDSIRQFLIGVKSSSAMLYETLMPLFLLVFIGDVFAFQRLIKDCNVD